MLPTLIAAEYFALGAATASHGQFVYTVSDGEGQLFWDFNGTADGGLFAIAVFTGAPTLSAADLYYV
jgi:hypothetical protein